MTSSKAFRFCTIVFFGQVAHRGIALLPFTCMEQISNALIYKTFHHLLFDIIQAEPSVQGGLLFSAPSAAGTGVNTPKGVAELLEISKRSGVPHAGGRSACQLGRERSPGLPGAVGANRSSYQYQSCRPAQAFLRKRIRAIEVDCRDACSLCVSAHSRAAQAGRLEGENSIRKRNYLNPKGERDRILGPRAKVLAQRGLEEGNQSGFALPLDQFLAMPALLDDGLNLSGNAIASRSFGPISS